ncbi:hypothetical protein AR158_c192L [Paramecium bursaria Chlorella virus AR158]|uniref:hypothetical protein n=1 Tax=Paramecium bursaria Chlorella virus AR158 TaxID=380598 RepID=UPI00015AA851|nr:hypothetical protein AR158_c192L [Paramecium bursaria Chlorella virus AR158]ABU43738.1 hypothetical protein AR158_c192L [Paramecium bursaria Chlorella virus AR158]
MDIAYFRDQRCVAKISTAIYRRWFLILIMIEMHYFHVHMRLSGPSSFVCERSEKPKHDTRESISTSRGGR